MKLKKDDKIIFDTETTGLLEADAVLLEKRPYITELFMFRIDGRNKIIDEYESFFYIPFELPPHITKITGITDSMLVGAPQFSEEYKKIAEFFLGARSMIAHNCPFDAGMLWIELSRIGMEFNFPWPINHICTIEKTMHLKNKRLNLSALHEIATGGPHKEGAHRAKQDVLALLRCYKWMVEEKIV